jgi:integrase
MASVYKRTDVKPIPPDAKVITRRGQRLAQFKDGRGRNKTAPLSDDGLGIMVERKCWYVAYLDENGKRQVAKGYTDKEASEQLGRTLEQQAEKRQAGLQAVDPAKVRTPFADVLDLYIADLDRAKCDDKYTAIIRLRMNKLAAECSWSTVGSMRAEAMTRWMARPPQSGLAPATLNQYLETAGAFANWCIDKSYLAGNPLAGIRKADESEKRRRRRGLSEDLLCELLTVAEARGRQLVYLTAMKTGLRRDELKKLQWGDVVLSGPDPRINLRGSANKARREDVIPLDAEMVEALTAAKPADAKPSDPVFPKGVPTMRTYKRDLERAGIPYRDGQGRQADFHALRKSYNMLLAKKGVSPRTAMQLMRHTDIRLTMVDYTDPALLDLAGAVEKLPRLSGRPKLNIQAG